MPQNHTRIDEKTSMGAVHYAVSDLDTVARFYREILGFAELEKGADSVSLGAGNRELLRLTKEPGARRVRGTAGLYHTAFLVPTRWDLAHLMLRIVHSRTPIQGTSNHGTHLAIYLPDPEGNGIELAWDFPKEAWPIKDGVWDMQAMPREGVDTGELMKELERDATPWAGLPAETVVGHVHLHVSDLETSERFYHETLGFDVMMKSYDFGALFVSAGGYHHHIGMNIWRGTGIPKAPPDALGLRTFTVLLPHEDELNRLRAKLADEQIEIESTPDGLLVKDPSGIGLLLSVASSG